MDNILRIGTRDSQLAVWQATLVKDELAKHGIASELVLIKSDGDIDLVTPLYAMGVQGVFTKTLDAALLSKRIDIAVHSMKDVPTQLAQGIQQAAVLKRANHKDIFIPNPNFKGDINAIFGRGKIQHVDTYFTPLSNETKTVEGHLEDTGEKVNAIIATSSVRRIAQWLKRFPHHTIENLRGNVNTRLRKVAESNWHGAVFAAAGLERIGLRPDNAIELDWMLPAPAQGAIMIVCREDDNEAKQKCFLLNDEATALCTKIERDFLKTLEGGCSAPIGAFAEIINDEVVFKGNVISVENHRQIMECGATHKIREAADLGVRTAKTILQNGADKIMEQNRNASK
jgi:hydroxymethylbilane synthase